MEVSLLHQLYVLAQTESLILEEKEFSELEKVVSRKKAIVEDLGRQPDFSQLSEPERRLELSEMSVQDRETLAGLKREAQHLLKALERVEERNLQTLKDLRAGSLASLQDLSLLKGLSQAYQPTRFSSSQVFDRTE
ncbi:MAG: hypothetical protein AB1898_11965 [Acidobacteriota bacterium]